MYLATANHVAIPPGSAVQVRLRPPDASLPEVQRAAEVLERDPKLDLAVLLVRDPPPFIAAPGVLPFDWARSPKALFKADRLRTIGNPHGRQWYSPFLNLERFWGLDGDDILFDAVVLGPGHSGGGLFAEDWRLVGMIIADEPPFGRALRLDTIVGQIQAWGHPIDLRIPALPPAPSSCSPIAPFAPRWSRCPPASTALSS